MNNLKRVLSLALASVMLIGMMAVSASATSFTDDADIENKEAVGTMVALNIIDGMGDGTYDPKGLLTRAQAAKMVFVALNGGRKNDNLTTKDTPTFTDIKGNWAEGYIEWAANRGIIAGIGGGLFNPKGNLTGTQLAKIMLVAIGYDAKSEKLEGNNDWGLYTNALALKKGFYDGLSDVDPEANITRDQAAQLILNACSAEMVHYTNPTIVITGSDAQQTKGDAEEYTDKRTILSNAYGAFDKTGVLNSYTYNDNAKTFTYYFGEDATTLGGGTARQFTTKENFTGLLGQKVKVLYKKYSNATVWSDNNNEIYGVYDVTPTLKETTLGAFTGVANTAVTGGNAAAINVYYNKPGAAPAVVAGVNVKSADASLIKAVAGTYEEPSPFKLVDLDGDGLWDYGFIAPVIVKPVTHVNSKGVTAGAAYTFEDDDIYAGAAKGDYAVIAPAAYNYAGVNTLTKASAVEGTVDRSRTNAGTSAETDLQIGGTWYSQGASSTNKTVLPVVGDEVKLVVVGNYYYYTEISTTTITDLVMIAQVEAKGLSTQTALAYFPDGTSAEIAIVSINGTTIANGAAGLNSGSAGDVYALYTYSVNDKGQYVIKDVDGTNKAGYSLFDTVVSVGNLNSSTTANAINVSASQTYRIADDAVIFVAKTDATKATKVLTGKDVKVWANAGGTWGTGGQILGAKVNGFETVKVAVVTGTGAIPGDSGSTKYGYVVSAKANLSYEGGKHYVNFQIWNGSEVVDVKENVQADGTVVSSGTTTNIAPYTQKSFVRYEDLGSGVVTKTEALTDAGTYTDASGNANYLGFWNTSVTALDGKAIKLSADGTTASANAYVLTDDTVVIGVNSDDKAGVEGVTLAISDADSSNVYTKNVYVLIDSLDGTFGNTSTEKVLAVFIDTAK